MTKIEKINKMMEVLKFDEQEIFGYSKDFPLNEEVKRTSKKYTYYRKYKTFTYTGSDSYYQGYPQQTSKKDIEITDIPLENHDSMQNELYEILERKSRIFAEEVLKKELLDKRLNDLGLNFLIK
jgi:hypothetical protein